MQYVQLLRLRGAPSQPYLMLLFQVFWQPQLRDAPFRPELQPLLQVFRLLGVLSQLALQLQLQVSLFQLTQLPPMQDERHLQLRLRDATSQPFLRILLQVFLLFQL